MTSVPPGVDRRFSRVATFGRRSRINGVGSVVGKGEEEGVGLAARGNIAVAEADMI